VHIRPCRQIRRRFDKLDAAGRTDAVAHAARLGVINLQGSPMPNPARSLHAEDPTPLRNRLGRVD